MFADSSPWFLVNLIRVFENLCLLSSLLKLYSITKVWISSEAVEPKMFLVIGSLVVFKKGSFNLEFSF